MLFRRVCVYDAPYHHRKVSVDVLLLLVASLCMTALFLSQALFSVTECHRSTAFISGFVSSTTAILMNCFDHVVSSVFT